MAGKTHHTKREKVIMSTVSPEPTPPDAPLDDGPSLVAILLRRSWLMALGALAGLGLGYL